MIPEKFRDIYPNPVQYVAGTPAVVFRDHRWTVPVVRFAAEAGLIRLPARVVTFDRHRDSLVPNGSHGETAWRRSDGSLEDLVRIVSRKLSPRDDDWIIGGMEEGLISDVVQFRTEPDSMEKITRRNDANGIDHRIFHLERPSAELTWKGALVNAGHEAAAEGVWDVLGWDPENRSVRGADDLLFDIDLDFFTICWETYTFPFPGEVYEGEFLAPRQSPFFEEYRPVDFIGSLIRAAGTVTIACEPDFCGGEEKARKILGDVNRHVLGGYLDTGQLAVDYSPVYSAE